MSCKCGQCGYVFGSNGELAAHLLTEHGLNANPELRSLANLYDIVEALSTRVKEMADAADEEYEAIGERLHDIEEALDEEEEV